MVDPKGNRITFYHGEKVEIVRGISRHSFPKHSHGSFCIGLVLEGNLKLHIQEKEFMLSENSVYFIPPFIEHTILSLNNRLYGYAVICLDNELVKHYNNAFLQNYAYRNDDIAKKVFAIYQRFCRTLDQRSLKQELLQLLAKEIKVEHNLVKNSEYTANSQTAEFIKEHIDEEVNLYEISLNVHTSKFHLLRQFKKQMGVTPYQYYIREKIRKVEYGLEEEQPIEDLVYDLKFSDQSHLCNVFKKYVGVTPMQYKKSHKKISELV